MFVALKHRFLAIIATALLGVIAVGLLRGDMDIDAAAVRAVVLVVAVVAIDRLVMPFVMLALAANKPSASTPAAAAASSPTSATSAMPAVSVPLETPGS
jgi:hypothetical protein